MPIDPNWYDIYKLPDQNFQLLYACSMELIGSFFFAYGFMTANNEYVQAVNLGAMTYFSFQISGAMYNPAITLNMYLRRRMNLVLCIALTVIQVAGAFAGAFMAYWCTDSLPPYPEIVILDGYNKHGQYAQAFFLELIGTFVLITLTNIQSTPTCTFTQNRGLYGLIFIFIYWISRIYTGHTGGLINPAFGIVFPVVSNIFKENLNNSWQYYQTINRTITNWTTNQSFIDQTSYYKGTYSGLSQCWVWIVASYSAAILAFLFFKFLYYPTFQQSKEKKQ